MIKNKLDNFDVGTLNYFITREFLTGFLFNALLILIKQDNSKLFYHLFLNLVQNRQIFLISLKRFLQCLLKVILI